MTEKRYYIGNGENCTICDSNKGGSDFYNMLTQFEAVDRLNEQEEKNRQLKEENYDLQDGLDFYKEQNGSLSEEISNLEYKNEQLKQTEKDCQELNHKLIIKNDELEQEIRKFKRIIDKLEVERCEYLNDKQAKSKWGDNYD